MKFLNYCLLCAACCIGQATMAQEVKTSIAEKEAIHFVYDIDNFSFFDNREVRSPYQHSQTLFGSRLGLEAGVQFDANTIMIGASGVKDFGESGITNKDLTFYYYYEEGHFSGAFGSFPRKRLKRELPDIFVYSSIATQSTV